jgi:hypothetical protein
MFQHLAAEPRRRTSGPANKLAHIAAGDTKPPGQFVLGDILPGYGIPKAFGIHLNSIQSCFLFANVCFTNTNYITK